MEEHLNFTPLLLVLFLAFAVPLFLSRLRGFPIIVGEILAGVIIGYSGLKLVGDNAVLEVFSNIGLAFLMFLAGLEIDFDKLIPATRRNSREASRENRNGTKEPNLIGYAAIVYLFTLALSIPGGYLLNRLGLEGHPWLLAFVLSATSLGVLLPILKQRSLTHTTAGQAIFLTALLSDFVTVILLTVFLILMQKGMDLEIFSIVLLFLVFFLVYRILGRFFQIQRVRSLVEELSQVTVQIKVRGALAILMAFVVLASLLGLELILGAFLAGMIISLIRAPEDIDLIHKLEAFGYGFFIPVFFIMVGVEIDLQALFETPGNFLLLPILFLISLLIKIVPALIFKRLMPWRETLASGFLLNTHLSIEIAIAIIGVRLGLLSPAASTGLIIFSVLTVFLNPIIFNTLWPIAAPKERRWMVIFGVEELGLQVARILDSHGERVCFLDQSTQRVEKARQAGFQAKYAETIGECLDIATRDQVESLMVLSSDDDRNLDVCRAATCQGIDHVVAMVTDPTTMPEYQNLGVNAFAPALYRPSLLALMARSPDIFKLLTTTTDEQDVREVCLENPMAANRRLRDLGLPGNLLVMAIGRDGELIIPHGSTQIQQGDRLTIMGNMAELYEAIAWLEQAG
jgi:Kef-type K+ transport system membrane component KefB/Trk K+ transport system NAD-binding subunit